jgi:alpha-ribazole phosphatase
MIVAVRHPKPAIAASICYGQLDVALAEPPAAAAKTLIDRLAQQRFDRIVASPLQRARHLAAAVAEGLGLSLDVDPRLQEMSFGVWEGLAWDAITREDIDAWAADPLGYRPRGGETVGELASRVEQIWREAAATTRHELWITHAGPMRCLYALMRKQPLAQCLDQRFEYGEVLELGAPV